jgi:CysZ protein
MSGRIAFDSGQSGNSDTISILDAQPSPGRTAEGPMIDAAVKALTQMFAPALRGVLLKAVGLALILIVVAGIVLQRLLSALAQQGADWAEQATGFAPHAAWEALAWILSIMAGIGIVTGALFLMPTIAAFVGSFFVDEVGEAVEREYYAAEPVGRALPFFRALIEGLKIAWLALLVYFCALPFILLAGLGVIILFLANAYLLGREYFELAAMRFRPPFEAKAMRKAHASTVFLAGMVIAVFVSIPVVNLATPVFAMAFMVHVHKRMGGQRAELIESAR